LYVGGTAGYSTSPAGVTISLLANTATGGDAQGDTFQNIVNLSGSLFADTLTGDDAANVLSALGGNDTLNGLGGDDTLVGVPVSMPSSAGQAAIRPITRPLRWP
jgi:Ca2+-binding RTX toxin-like protein